MTFFETLATALRELALHKFRSGLAALGVIFGVASVMAMLSIGEGARRQTLERIAVLGLDNVILRSAKPPRPPANSEEAQSNVLRYGLTRADVAHLRATFVGLRYAVGVRVLRREIRPGSGRPPLDLSILATEPDYLHVTRSAVTRGRFLLHSDNRTQRMVCVLGVDAARKIFAFADPIGQTVNIGGDWFEVVGLLRNAANLKDAGGDDINHAVFIPLATSQGRYGDLAVQNGAGSYDVSNVELDAIALQLVDEDDVAATARRVQTYLRLTHPRNDYGLLVPLELMEQKAATQRIFTVVMGSIASISLLVGGIGIMNIMLANVSDRRREIGTRRALGARRLDIIRQFLLEAAALTTLGGLFGVGIGYGLSRGVSTWADWPVVITPQSVALGLAVSCLSGILFGFWPAYQAAKVNPIEALRAM
jgi:putative ABC transport system permease protein